MDYYKRYMGDYGRDTSRLSMIEHGAYNLMLDDYYSTRTPLPADLDELYRICRATSKPEQAAVAAVAKRFFPVSGDGLRHSKRADEEIAKWEAMAEENREKGKLGGRPKKNPSSNPPGNPMGSGENNPEETRRDTNGFEKGAISKPAQNPLQNPNPKPEARSLSHSHVRDARAQGEVDQRRHVNGTDPPIDSLPYEQAIQAKFPKGSNASNWTDALHYAGALVSNGAATWPELEDAVERYARYFTASGQLANIAAHNFFDPRKSNWSQPWDTPLTKGQAKQNANIDAARKWLAQSEGK